MPQLRLPAGSHRAHPPAGAAPPLVIPASPAAAWVLQLLPLLLSLVLPLLAAAAAPLEREQRCRCAAADSAGSAGSARSQQFALLACGCRSAQRCFPCLAAHLAAAGASPAAAMAAAEGPPWGWPPSATEKAAPAPASEPQHMTPQCASAAPGGLTAADAGAGAAGAVATQDAARLSCWLWQREPPAGRQGEGDAAGAERPLQPPLHSAPAQLLGDPPEAWQPQLAAVPGSPAAAAAAAGAAAAGCAAARPAPTTRCCYCLLALHHRGLLAKSVDPPAICELPMW